jgi:sterol desaturase/sphingolipid hydroxylase (fatty acid hydroxylase superfamily)
LGGARARRRVHAGGLADLCAVPGAAAALIALMVGARDWRGALRAARHPSSATDVKLFLLGRFGDVLESMVMAGCALVTAALVVGALRSATGAAALDADWSLARAAVLTLALLMVTDFCTYWVHRLHHEHPALWPFHAVHHSAEVLTPLTIFRKHPVYDLISALIKGSASGAAQGVLLFVFTGDYDIVTIASANALYVLYATAGANLRHSHVWLTFGPLGRIFIAPAQHQIHHSIDPRHHNKNYGEIFALWDWLFGTLYLPRERETLAFGIGDAAGVRITQPHPTLAAALVVPFRESWRALRDARRESGEGMAAASQRAASQRT